MRIYVRQSLLVLSLFLGFMLVFKLLQIPAVYHAVSGKIFKTYVKDDWGNRIGVKEPYNKLDEDKFYHWDAAHYYNLRNSLYSADSSSGTAIFAFFPLFPLIWKLTGLSGSGICMLNYLLFSLSLFILLRWFLPAGFSKGERLRLIALSLLLPSAISFYIPYTEATFMLMFALAIHGLFTNRYWLFFAGMLLLAMTRPIVTILSISFILMDLYYLWNRRNVRIFLKDTFLKFLPVLAGTLIVCLMQYPHSGSLFSFFKAQSLWNHHFRFPEAVSDWSQEGFGVNVFTIFFVIFPGAWYLFSLFLTERRTKAKAVSLFGKDQSFKADYLFRQSVVYLIGAFLFILFFEGGSLNGLFRYTLSTPFFYIFFYTLVSRVSKASDLHLNMGLFFIFLLAIFYMNSVSYGSKWTIQDSGFWISSAMLFYLITEQKLPPFIRNLFFGIVIFAGIIWQTYLFNMFLSDGWIFT